MRASFVFVALKGIALGYWAGVLVAVISEAPSTFQQLLAATAPAVVSMHFLQVMLFMRLLKPEARFMREVLLTLVFGAFHLGPKVLAARQAQRSRAQRTGQPPR